jgi:NAD(P)-dependent dehydrogenase (short-subunit alcohol dehydrogenase family)
MALRAKYVVWWQNKTGKAGEDPSREELFMAKTIVITGASDGIGAAGARQLHQDGHRVVIVGRSPDKTTAVAREIGADGFEKTLQVNHLSPFLLTNLLMDKLLASRASVIQTSSSGARLFGKLDIDDLNNDTKYTPQRAYGTAKLENILFTRELHTRFHARGLSAAAFHPGAVATSFGSESTGFMRSIYASRIARAFMNSPEKGARQMVWLAEGVPGTDWQSGVYYERGKPARRNNPQANDAGLARALWDRSADLVGAAVR